MCDMTHSSHITQMTECTRYARMNESFQRYHNDRFSLTECTSDFRNIVATKFLVQNAWVISETSWSYHVHYDMTHSSHITQVMECTRYVQINQSFQRHRSDWVSLTESTNDFKDIVMWEFLIQNTRTFSYRMYDSFQEYRVLKIIGLVCRI